MKFKSKINGMNLTLGKIYFGSILNTNGNEPSGFGSAKYKIVVFNDNGALQEYLAMHFEPAE